MRNRIEYYTHIIRYLTKYKKLFSQFQTAQTVFFYQIPFSIRYILVDTILTIRRVYIVQRGVFQQVLKLSLVVRAAVVRHPRVSNCELLEPQHVQHSERKHMLL